MHYNGEELSPVERDFEKTVREIRRLEKKGKQQ